MPDRSIAIAASLLVGAILAPRVSADIFRWDNGQVIPGTEGITPGPGVQLNNWNSDEHNLQFANLSDVDLSLASFAFSWLDSADFSRTDLTGAQFRHASVANAQFTDAIIAEGIFSGVTEVGFTKDQLYSTASYQAKDLHGIELSDNNLTGWDFSGQNVRDANFSFSGLTVAYFRNATANFANFVGANLTETDFYHAGLTDADFSNAVISLAFFDESNLTKEQLYSTASYQAKDLHGIVLTRINLTGWDFSGQNLTGANLGGSTLTNANLTGAVVRGANFTDFSLAPSLTKEQLYSTASYQAKDLQGIRRSGNNLTGWDFGGQDVRWADFSTHSFTKEQLNSTASYQAKDLRGIRLTSNVLTGWDFSGQNLAGARFGENSHGSNLANANLSGANLTNADLSSSTLTNANLLGANLTNANLYNTYLTNANFAGANLTNAYLYSILTNANLTGAVVRGANFYSWPSRGLSLTKEQLYSTASYQAKDLQGIGFLGFYHDFTGWDFSGQNLTNAELPFNFANVILTGADIRGVKGNYSNSITMNLIGKDGHIAGLNLTTGQSLWVRDYDGDSREWRLLDPIAILIHDSMTVAADGVLRLCFESDTWDSLISFQTGIPIQLGGSLQLTFDSDVDVASQIGRTIRVFDWTGVSPIGRFSVASPYTWNTSSLYTTGEVTLLAVPEPTTTTHYACSRPSQLVFHTSGAVK